jgi:coenzyme F420-reducing hydrogenase beta subunit
MNICDKKLCTGCSACSTCCKQNAISMIKNDEGFLYPFIDETKCVNCEKCKKICPINNINIENNQNPEVYAVIASDEIRETSTSGGAFSILANYVLNSNSCWGGGNCWCRI